MEDPTQISEIAYLVLREANLYVVYSWKACVQVRIKFKARLLSIIAELRTHLEFKWSIWTDSLFDRLADRSRYRAIPFYRKISYLLTLNLISVYLPVPFGERMYWPSYLPVPFSKMIYWLFPPSLIDKTTE